MQIKMIQLDYEKKSTQKILNQIKYEKNLAEDIYNKKILIKK